LLMLTACALSFITEQSAIQPLYQLIGRHDVARIVIANLYS
jgi:hypothetical protein